MTHIPSNGGDPPARSLTGLFVALGLALASRLTFVGSQSLTMDELSELSIARSGVAQIVNAQDGFPPLYHLLLHAWLEVFSTNAAARWLSVLLGVLTVVCVWRLARLLVGPRGADWAAFVFSLLPFHIWFSQEARAYALLILLAALSLWMFFRARETNQRGDWALFVAASAAGMYVHYFFAVLLGTLALCLLLDRGGGRARRAWISLAGVAVLCIPDVLLLSADLAYQSNPHAAKPTFGPEALGYTYLSFICGYTIGPSVRELHTLGARDALRQLLPWLLIITLAVGYLAWRAVRAPEDGGMPRPLLVLCLVPVALLGTLTLAGGVGYNVRYASWVVVPVVIALGAGLANSVRLPWGRAALAVLVLTFALARWNRVAVDRYREEDSRALAAFLEKQDSAPRSVLVASGYMAVPIDYYLGNEWTVGRVPDVSPTGEGLDEAVAMIEVSGARESETWFAYTRPFHGDRGGWLADRVMPVATLVRSFAGIDLYLIDAGELGDSDE